MTEMAAQTAQAAQQGLPAKGYSAVCPLWACAPSHEAAPTRLRHFSGLATRATLVPSVARRRALELGMAMRAHRSQGKIQ